MRRPEARVAAAPDTRYAVAPSGTQIAYRMAGSGATTLLGFDTMTTVDVMYDEPRAARLLERLSTFSRHVWFDRRGTGSSGPLPAGEARLIETAVEDMLAVLDAVRVERAVVLGLGGLSALAAMLFAATHPQRVKALLLLGPSARYRADDGYPGLDDDTVETILDVIGREWGTGVLSRLLGVADSGLEPWYGRAERLRYTPRDAVEVHRALYDSDLRSLLPTLSVPTVVVARREPQPSQSRFVADHIPGAVYREIAGPGLSTQLLDAVEELATGQLGPRAQDRVLATVLFSDIVGSTAHAAALGDRRWRARLDEHDAMVRRHLAAFRGREVKATGDGFLATFDGPARAIRCACAVRDAAAELGLQVRIGLHTGEVDTRGDDISGVAVHIGARVAALASASQVLVSRTVADLVAGSGIPLDDRGEHELKGVAGLWRVFAVTG